MHFIFVLKVLEINVFATALIWLGKQLQIR